jgi:hypothetical protein
MKNSNTIQGIIIVIEKNQGLLYDTISLFSPLTWFTVTTPIVLTSKSSSERELPFKIKFVRLYLIIGIFILLFEWDFQVTCSLPLTTLFSKK